MADLQQILPIAGAPPVFATKARAFFKAHREHRLGKGRFWLGLSKWLIPLGGTGTVAGVAAMIASGVGVPLVDMVGFGALFVGLPSLLVGLIAKSFGQGFMDQPEVVPDVQALLRALAADWAAKQPLDGELDLRAASEAVTSERSATSPYSGATKLYYRHRWFRAAGKLADGSTLALEGVALVKTKSGHEIRRELQLRGRLRPGTALRAPGWRGERTFGRLRAIPDREAGGSDVLFWGPVAAMDDVLPDLEALVRELAGVKAAAHAPGPEEAGGAVGPVRA